MKNVTIEEERKTGKKWKQKNKQQTNIKCNNKQYNKQITLIDKEAKKLKLKKKWIKNKQK